MARITCEPGNFPMYQVGPTTLQYVDFAEPGGMNTIRRP
jgi:hypothetical protein